MDDHQRPDGIAVTRFILQSIYAQSDEEKLEFEYESGNTNILVRYAMFLFCGLEDGWSIFDKLCVVVQHIASTVCKHYTFE